MIKGEAQRLRAVESHDPLIQATGLYLHQHFSNLSQIHTSQQLQFDLNGVSQFVRVMP